MARPPAIPVSDGIEYYPGFLDRREQEALRDELWAIVTEAPLYRPRMPRTAKPFSVRMSNCGPLGWMSDERGYRYQRTDPKTGRPWPPMPGRLIEVWRLLVPDAPPPEACLINFYEGDAKMGLHQDRDEQDLSAPVLSLSLGDSALFRLGGLKRSDPTRSFWLKSGDALTFGGPGRLVFHGIDRIAAVAAPLLPNGGRINLTLRRVTPSPSSPQSGAVAGLAPI